MTEVDEYYRSMGWMLSPCEACARLKTEGGPDGAGSSCEAYPSRIPEVVYRGIWDHRLPREDDRGLLFEPGRIRKTLDGRDYIIGYGGELVSADGRA